MIVWNQLCLPIIKGRLTAKATKHSAWTHHGRMTHHRRSTSQG